MCIRDRAPSLPPTEVLPPDPDLWVEVVRSAALRVWSSRPSAAHAFRLAWGLTWLGCTSEGRERATQALGELGVPLRTLLAFQEHCQSLAADHGLDSPESLVSWLGAEAAQDLPVMMGTPPE
eukprot:11628034-Alexandrium_andersonii.AAC.1